MGGVGGRSSAHAGTSPGSAPVPVMPSRFVHRPHTAGLLRPTSRPPVQLTVAGCVIAPCFRMSTPTCLGSGVQQQEGGQD
jgi:hypothetical protein